MSGDMDDAAIISCVVREMMNVDETCGPKEKEIMNSVVAAILSVRLINRKRRDGDGKTAPKERGRSGPPPAALPKREPDWAPRESPDGEVRPGAQPQRTSTGMTTSSACTEGSPPVFLISGAKRGASAEITDIDGDRDDIKRRVVEVPDVHTLKLKQELVMLRSMIDLVRSHRQPGPRSNASAPRTEVSEGRDVVPAEHGGHGAPQRVREMFLHQFLRDRGGTRPGLYQWDSRRARQDFTHRKFDEADD